MYWWKISPSCVNRNGPLVYQGGNVLPVCQGEKSTCVSEENSPPVRKEEMFYLCVGGGIVHLCIWGK